jgi:inosine-uridine nucleoside N-ribohydrolase
MRAAVMRDWTLRVDDLPDPTPGPGQVLTKVSRHDDMNGAAVHDPCAVMSITHPELFRSREVHVAVEAHGRITRGQTVVDQRSLLERLPPNCTMQVGIDADAAFAVIVESIAHYSS